ncbi:MAG TPA: hypothetical protein DD670_14450 [Planctomycetaceae bacterium]|nr:hypothetical protein [Planctomycetaceae bacterium]
MMAKRKKPRKPTTTPKFKVGDKVRVKHGIKDTDYPDIPLGGWAGKITEIHDDGMCTIRCSCLTSWATSNTSCCGVAITPARSSSSATRSSFFIFSDAAPSAIYIRPNRFAP